MKTYKNRQAKQMQKKSTGHTVVELDLYHWMVVSGTSQNSYEVFSDGSQFSCTCDWGKYHPVGECSHTIAVRQQLARVDGHAVSVWSHVQDARRQHRAICDISDGLIFTTRKH